MQCAPAAGSLGRWPGSRLLAQCLAPAAFSSWLAKPGHELAPWEHKVQRGQTTNSRVERPNNNVSTHPLPSTVPASTLTAVTRHQVWPARCNGPPHEISPSPSPALAGLTKAGPSSALCSAMWSTTHSAAVGPPATYRAN